MGAGNHFVGVERGAEYGHQTRGGRAKGQRAGSDRQPALHAGGGGGFLGQPGAVVVLLRQVDQDGVGVGDHRAVVIDDRDLAERVEGQEVRLLVRTFGQVDEYQLGGQVQQREHQLDAVGVARLGKVVKLDRVRHGLGSWSAHR
ncbi:hypothetical protein D9M71_537670 [compost metagenome]